MKKYGLVAAFGLIAICLFASSTQAHMLWLSPDNTSPEPGETVTITIGFGHHYPQGKMEKANRLKGVHAISPKGNKIECQRISPATYTFTPDQKGIYWLYSAMKPGFVSNTTKGRKLGNKETLEKVISCSAFRMSAMSPISCGDARWHPAKSGNHELEILPLSNPASIDSGDVIELKVLFQGKPLSGASLSMTGSQHGESHHHRHEHGHHHDHTGVETDADGIARIKLTSDGSWLFNVKHEIPYPNEALCDSFLYITSLTLDF